jgi:hypothetical protein
MAIQSDPQFVVIDHAVTPDNTLVAAVAGKRIRVLALYLMSVGSVLVRFESATGGTALTGQMTTAANVNISMPYNPAGWFQTIAGELLNLELSAAVSVDGCLVYVLVE